MMQNSILLFRRLLKTSAWIFLCTAAGATPLVAATVSIDWTTVGDPGNYNDDSIGDYSWGAVAYSFNIDKYKLTNNQYVQFLNAKDPTGANTLGTYRTSMTTSVMGGINYNPAAAVGQKYSIKTGQGNQPANLLTWYSAIRYINWLNNGQGSGDTETGAYTLLGGVPTPTNSITISRNTGALVALPNENEWYKAAFYDPNKPGGPGYWDYPTRSDTAPVSAMPPGYGTTPSANYYANDHIANGYNDGFAATGNGEDYVNPKGVFTGGITVAGVNYLTNVGAYTNSPSAYGTYDQAGLIWEWLESVPVNIVPGTADFRTLRGGLYSGKSDYMSNAYWAGTGPNGTSDSYGFRIIGLTSTSHTWTSTGSADWNSAGNWNNNYVPDSGMQVAFGSSGSTALIDLGGSGRKIGSITFTNGNAQGGTTISGSAGAVLTLGGYGGRVESAPGTTNIISTPVLLDSDIDVAGAGTLRFDGPLSGARGLVKKDAGSLVLSTSNTYSGNTVLNAGNLTLGSPDSLKYSTLVWNAASSGTLDHGTFSAWTLGGLAGDHNLDLGGGQLTVGYNSGNSTYAGTLSNGSLVKVGSGQLTLHGVDTYAGGTTISSGTLQAATPAALPGYNASGLLSVATGGMLKLPVGITGWSSTAIGALASSNSGGFASGSFLGLDTGNGDFSLDAPVAGALGLAKIGRNVLQLNSPILYSGSTYLGGGTLQADGSVNAFPGGITVAAGVLQLVGSANATTDFSAGAFTVQGPSVINVANGLGGSANLNVTSLAASPGKGRMAIFNVGDVFAVSNAPALSNGIIGPWAVTGSDWLTYSGSGPCVLQPYSAYQTATDPTTWTATDNVKVAASVSAVPTSTINTLDMAGTGILTMASSTTLSIASGGLLASGTGAMNGGTLVGSSTASELLICIAGASSNLTINSVIGNTGTQSITKTGQGTLTLNGNNTFAGGLTIAGGAVAFASRANLGAVNSPLTFDNGAILRFTGSSAALYTSSGWYPFVFQGDGTIDVSSGTLSTCSTNWSGSGTFTKSGTGSLALVGVSNFSGAISIQEGSLSFQSSGTLPATSAVSLGKTARSVGTLDLGGYSATIGGLADGALGGGVVANTGSYDSTLTVNQADTSTFSGSLTDGPLARLEFVLQGSGELVLTGSNSATGGVRVEGGTLVFSSAAAIRDGSALSVGAGAALEFGSPAGANSSQESSAATSAAPVPEPGSLTLTVVAAVTAAAALRSRRSFSKMMRHFAAPR
jgi:autotransporter-associated beta strand protein